MRHAVWVVVAGCGRLGFDHHAGDAPGDAVIDARDAAAIDTPSDSPLDGAPAACLSDPAYVTIGSLVHRYREATTGIAWDGAKTACEADGAYLWIANDATEANLITGDWMGLTDAATEGTWLTVKGTPAPYLVWQAGEPTGGTSENCGRNDSAGFESRACSDQRDYACECE